MHHNSCSGRSNVAFLSYLRKNKATEGETRATTASALCCPAGTVHITQRSRKYRHLCDFRGYFLFVDPGPPAIGASMLFLLDKRAWMWVLVLSSSRRGEGGGVEDDIWFLKSDLPELDATKYYTSDLWPVERDGCNSTHLRGLIEIRLSSAPTFSTLLHFDAVLILLKGGKNILFQTFLTATVCSALLQRFAIFSYSHIVASNFFF